jgi:hypothetical protein
MSVVNERLLSYQTSENSFNVQPTNQSIATAHLHPLLFVLGTLARVDGPVVPLPLHEPYIFVPLSELDHGRNCIDGQERCAPARTVDRVAIQSSCARSM